MNQHVRIRPEIGRAPIIARDFPEGFSLIDMVRDVAKTNAGALPPEFWRYAVAQVGRDERCIVLPEHWHLIRPRKGTKVNFSLPPGDDDAFNTLLQVTIIGAQLFANLIPGIGPLVSAAIGIGGSFLLAELAPKPKGQSGGGSPKQLGQAGFSNNVLSPYEQLWRVLGRKRVAAPHLAPPYVEIVGEDAFAKCVIGLAGRHDVSDIRINGADPLTTLVGQAINIRTGLPSDGPLSIYNSIVWQEQSKRLQEYNLVQDVANDRRIDFVHQVDREVDMPQYSTFRLGKIRPDRIVIDLLWDGGIAQSKNDAKAGVAFELGFKKADGSMIWLPQLHYLANYRGPLRSKLIIEFAADPGGLTAPSSNSPWRQAFANTVAQSGFGYGAHSYYGTGDVASHVGVTSPNICTIYVDPSQVPVSASDRFWIRRGAAYLPNRMNYSTNKYQWNGGSAINGFWWSSFLDGGVWKCMEDQAQFYSTCTIEFLTRIWDAEPMDPSGLTTIEMSVRSTQIDSITFVAGGYVRYKWDRTLGQWTNEPHVSENPAEQVYDVLKNPDPVLNARPLADKLIDSPGTGFGLGALAAWCIDNDKTSSIILEGGSVEDAIAPCFQAGHARLVRSRKWGAWIDKDRSGEAPIKIFGPRDFWNFQIERIFEHRDHAWRCTFDDRNDDWITVPERLVFAPGRDISNSTLFGSADYRSITDDYNVDKRARQDLAIIKYRARTISFETRNRWLSTPRGSLVGVNSPVLSSAHVTAGIRQVIYDDPNTKANIKGIVLDGEVEMQAGITGIAISGLNAQVFLAQSVDPGPTRRVMFSTPLANDAGIDEGALVAFGTAGNEYLRCYVDDIKPGPRGTAKLILVDEGPEIFGAGGTSNNDLYASPDLYGETDLYNLNN